MHQHHNMLLKWPVERYEKAARQGSASAQLNLAFMYFHGSGVPQDSLKAIYWFTQAAQQGNSSAQNNLGIAYENGNGVEQDDTLAAYWYEKAAQQGNAKAQNNLAYLYAHGKGVKKDYQRALGYYQQSALNNNPLAQNNLATMYECGLGITMNPQMAIYWYKKAIALGNAAAEKNLHDFFQKKIYILHEAATICDVNFINSLLAGDITGKREELDKPDRNGLTALHHAALHGNVAVVKFLLSQGAKTAPPTSEVTVSPVIEGRRHITIAHFHRQITEKNYQLFFHLSDVSSYFVTESSPIVETV